MNDPTPCEQCGQPHARCSAHTRAGKPCGQPPMADQTVCKMHGGKAPQALDAAARRRQDREALLAVETFGLPRVVDPHTALLEELHRTAGAVAWLDAVVADIEVAKLDGSAPVKLWHEERDKLVKVAKACVDVGIEERRVRLAEQAGAQVASVIRSVIEALYAVLVEVLGPHEAARRAFEAVWSSAVLEIVPRELRRLGGDEEDR